jgi:hypothetical protein
MPASALTSDNSAIVMIDHAAGFGNVFRSHNISLRRPPETRPPTAPAHRRSRPISHPRGTGPDSKGTAVPDHGHEPAFGTCLTPQNQRPAEVVTLAQLTKRAGFDLARHTQVRDR